VDLKCEKSMFFLIEHKPKKINTNKREKKKVYQKGKDYDKLKCKSKM
jgi:hypothetical protein